MAYLGAGAILGPGGLGSLIPQFPPLYWITVVDVRNIEGIADLGVVFLLFLIGLELSFQRLTAMRRLVFGLGILQVLITTAAVAGVLVVAGQPAPVAAVLGGLLSLSSTAMVLELLSREGRMGTHTGRASFSVLLAQDLAVVPMLMFIAALAGTGGEHSILQSLATALLQAAAALIAIAIVGRTFLRPLFRQVAATESSELFIAAVLFVVVGAGIAAYEAGLSMALGAFVAGLLLAETEFGKAIEVTVDPFKGLLLGIFFFTVGMSIDFRVVLREPLLLTGTVIGLLTVKAAILFGLARLFKLSRDSAAETALLLAPGSEFAFVGIGLASASQLLPPSVSSVALAALSISMAFTPVLSALGWRIAARIKVPEVMDPELLVRPTGEAPKAIVVGYGRVGQIVSSLLMEHHIAFVAVDRNSSIVGQERHRGRHEIFYGDAADEAFLRACGLLTATALVVTIDAHDMADAIVRIARRLRPDLQIVARARDAQHAQHLYAVGATTAIPETVEASFQLSEATLVGLGVPTGLAIASIHERRDQLRAALKQAAQRADGAAAD